jgi:hypothetical protein
MLFCSNKKYFIQQIPQKKNLRRAKIDWLVIFFLAILLFFIEGKN